MIRTRVKSRKSHPSAARGAKGTATVRLLVTSGGGLAGVSLVGSSGKVGLDTAVLQAVSRVGRFPVAPDGLAEPQYSFHLQISFKT